VIYSSTGLNHLSASSNDKTIAWYKNQGFDFGDAPSSYPTTRAQDGARHRPVGPHLGAARDFEDEGQPSANADGDDFNGIPEFIRARKAMQYSSSIDEFAKWMSEGNNGGYANTWLVADRKSNEVASLELGLKNVTLRRTKDDTRQRLRRQRSELADVLDEVNEWLSSASTAE